MAELIGVAFAFSYIGDAFHGSQIQPDIKTVQSQLLIAFHNSKFTGDEPHLRISSRTDAGVNARMNIGRCKISAELWPKMGSDNFRRALNDHLDDIVVWAAVPVSHNWNPRIAIQRVYRYRFECMPEFINTFDEDAVLSGMKLFEGTHDFSGFCRVEEGRAVVKTVDYCKPWIQDGRVIGFEIAAKSFLWNQVRRIAWTLATLGRGVSTLEEIKQAIDSGTEPASVGMGSSKWLTLWQIHYEDIVFTEILGPMYRELPAPPKKMDERQYRAWSRSCHLQHKNQMMVSWLPALKR